jgi:hypothetical protein
MSENKYVVMAVECGRCKTKQKIHIANRIEIAQKGNERIPCVSCQYHFEVKLPNKFIRGPFPA